MNNYGAYPEFSAVAWTNGGSLSDHRALLMFDLSEIPVTATVTSALLTLYFDPASSNGEHSNLSGPNTALLQRITSPWAENTVTWDNQPNSTSVGELVLPTTTTATEDRPDMDVTTAVQNMVSDPANNFGWLFKLQTESYYRRMIFSSSDHPERERHPKLVVNYIDEVGINSPSNLPALGIFPNPVSNVAQVDLSDRPAKEYSLMLMDMLGRNVYEERFIGGSIVPWDLSTMDRGSYQIVVLDQGQAVASSRVVLH